MLLSANVQKKFPGGVEISAALQAPENAAVTVLFGPSGAGKTTVLRAIAGLDDVGVSQIVFKGKSWTTLPPQRRPVGYVFQDYALFSHLSVRDNIGFGIRGAKHREERIRRIAGSVQVNDLLDRNVTQLSGGQQQRVALARALAREPELLLLDEPLSALDPATRGQVRSELSRFLSSVGVPAIVVTHDWEDALSWADWLVVMKQGRIIQSGSPSEVFTRPSTPDVAGIVGVETVVAGRVLGRHGGAVRLAVGTTELYAADPGDDETEYFVCIRGENVTLEQGAPIQSSARNHLPGRIIGTSAMGSLMRITIDVGFDLVALITRQAMSDMNLDRGSGVIAVFKASAVHLIARGQPKER